MEAISSEAAAQATESVFNEFNEEQLLGTPLPDSPVPATIPNQLLSNASCGVKVVCRFRPLNEREIATGKGLWCVAACIRAGYSTCF